jgi:uncharacterized membrane protein
MGEMAIIARLHPLIVHFPIALVMVAAISEVAAIGTGDKRYRTVAVINLRAGAAFSIVAMLAGWRLASAPGIDATPLLEWHRWLGAGAAMMTAAAAIATRRTERHPPRYLIPYRIALFGAAALVAGAGHSGGLLVWGADFLRL